MTATDKQAITKTLLAYSEALNNCFTEDAVSLYAPGAAFMAQKALTAIPTATLTKAYDFVFQTITLSVKFMVHEAVPFGNDERAFARTYMAGTQEINARGRCQTRPARNFLSCRRMGKIARYGCCIINSA